MTPIEFPAAVGGYPTVVMAERIESIERGSYSDQCVLVLTSGRRVGAGCSTDQAAQLIRDASNAARDSA